MSFNLKIEVAADSATPALEHLVDSCAPRRVAEKLRDPLLDLVRRHYESLPPNKHGWPSTGFWHGAADATFTVEDDTGLTITTYKTGVRQRFLGGEIHAARAKNLSIPACAEAYGKLPADFDNLAFIQFGRGQDAPRALIKVSGDTSETRGKIMFWLTPSVHQDPNLNVLPTDDEIFSAIDEALKAPLSS